MYFEKPGRENTDETLTLAYDRGRALGLKEVVAVSPFVEATTTSFRP